MRNFSLNIIALLLIFTFSIGCKKDKLLTDESANISLSSDSILFDTLFTTVGSVTKSFKIYNPYEQPLKISSVRLAGGSNSNYRINLDGVPNIAFSDIEIPAKDSLYCFVEVTVNPNNQNNPLIIKDSILFETNGNQKKIILEAWGQDAYFHKNVYLPCNSVWKNDKPHVIYGIAIIPAGCTLTIQQGTQIHLHRNSVLAADSGATLLVQGKKGQEVIFQGDRLETSYTEAAGQWGYLWLSSLSKNNVIEWAVIKNGIIGIVCDTFANPGTATLTIKNSVIRNMSAFGIWARGSSIQAYNSVFANCGQHVLAISYGGWNTFYHCTFANYWSGGNRVFETVLLNNYYEDANGNLQTRALDSSRFYNCIVYGNNEDEIKLDRSTNTGINYSVTFHNTLIKTSLAATNPSFVNCVLNQEPDFVNTGNNNYHLGTLSKANGIGDVAFVNRYYNLLLFDFDLIFRLQDGPPDAGAYEYRP